VGGIDRQGKEWQPEPADDPAEIEQRKAEVRAEREGKTKKGSKLEAGDRVWVNDPDGTWDGELETVYKVRGQDFGRVANALGQSHDVPMSKVSLDEPA